MNLSGSVNVLRLFTNPALCLPHFTVSSFEQLPVPLSTGFITTDERKRPEIRAVVLDKDNCFAVPGENVIHARCIQKFQQLRETYPGSRVLIVSNSSGTKSDHDDAEAQALERNTGVHVLRHAVKKPGCHAAIMQHFRDDPDIGVTSPSQIAIVGDRLFTDILMANMMGAHGIWIRDGVVPNHGLLTRVEKGVFSVLSRRGYAPPQPCSDFE